MLNDKLLYKMAHEVSLLAFKWRTEYGATDNDVITILRWSVEDENNKKYVTVTGIKDGINK